MLKNIDEDIPINVDLSDTSDKNSASMTRTSTISKIEIIHKIYEETVKSELKKEILLQLRHRFLTEKKEKKHLEEILQSLNDQISIIIYNNNIDNVSNSSNDNISIIKWTFPIIPALLEKVKVIPWNKKARRKYDIYEISKNEISKYLKMEVITVICKWIFIMCDSLVQHVRGSKLPPKVENGKVFFKSFLGAKAICIENCIGQTLREISIHVIFDAGRNDVPIKLKRNSDISISSITTRNYQYQRKAADLNRKLKEKCCEKELQFLDIIPNIITG